MDELKDHFLANTSHELRTPLNGIIGLSDSLLGGAAGELTEPVAANLRMITASGRRLASLVNDILDFSKLRHDEIKLAIRPVDLRQLTELVLLTLAPMLGGKPLALRNALPDPLFVSADENRVQQILYNLLGNAVKFTESGEVAVTAERDGGLWRIHIRDTGIGIAADQQEAIFDSFVQSDGSAARAYGGTGLGLPITKRLVELHGGRMWLESAEGAGSVFSFSLPAADDPAVAAGPAAAGEALPAAESGTLFQEPASEREAESAWVEPEGAGGGAELAAGPDDEAGAGAGAFERGCDIMIVDDEPVNLQVLHNYLSLERHRVTQAGSGQMALDILDTGYLPDLLIIDVMMPRMTGFELCRRIRERFGSKTSLPILMLTAKDQERDVLEGFNSGANDYITKPVSRSELMARLRLHLQLARWNRSLEERVAERTLAIRNLLDHAGQGFLTFDDRLFVEEEYSAECRSMFGRDIAFARIDELLGGGRPDDPAYIADVLTSLFASDDALHREVCLSLLPDELQAGDKKIVLQYKPIADGRIMAVLTDISEQRRLENKMENERQMLKMVVQVITYYRDFKDLLHDYRAFAETGVHSLMGAEAPLTAKWSELYHHVHTFKGNFAQIDFMVVVDKLHALEAELLEWQGRLAADPDDPFLAAFFGEFIGECAWLSWLDADLDVLRGILGERFEEGQDTITLEKARLYLLERRVAELLPGPEAGAVAAEIRKLRYRPFRDLLALYRDYVPRLAAQTGKNVYPLEFVGGELPVNPDVYGEFARSLIHVFRNMLDHGIETAAERLAQGKDERGLLRVSVAELEADGVLELRLFNDGAPLDMARLKRLAVERGLYSSEQFDALSPAEQRAIVFAEQISTRSVVSELSGRGVGLSAVRRTVEQLGGSMALDSSAAHGTTMIIRLPLR